MENQEFDSNYRYVLVAARRARQLLSGARPTIETSSRKPCKIAMEEISAGKVRWNEPEPERSPVEVANQLLDKAMESGPEEE
jgi:DNA-directed RNA polymerase subunit omega